MLYSDSELKFWWLQLHHADREDLIRNMIDNASSDQYRNMAEDFLEKLENGDDFSPRQLAAIRKWER